MTRGIVIVSETHPEDGCGHRGPRRVVAGSSSGGHFEELLVLLVLLPPVGVLAGTVDGPGEGVVPVDEFERALFQLEPSDVGDLRAEQLRP